MRTITIEQRIPIGIPDPHDIVFSPEVFEQGLQDDASVAPRIGANHDESTAPIGKVTRIATRVETANTSNVGVLRCEITFGEITDYGDLVMMRFREDHRPFLSPISNKDITVDLANFERHKLDDFIAQAQEIFPESTVGFKIRKSIEPETVLWIAGAVATVAVAARNFPIIGPILKDVEDGIVESVDAKGKIQSIIAKFRDTTGKSKFKVNTTVPVGTCSVVLLADGKDAAEALGEAHIALNANADVLADATEALFIYQRGRWEFQYKALNSGDVQMTRECFERTMSALTDTGSIIYPEQVKYIKIAFHLNAYPINEGKWETQVNYLSPSGTFLTARAATAEHTNSGILLTFRNGERQLFTLDNEPSRQAQPR